MQQKADADDYRDAQQRDGAPGLRCALELTAVFHPVTRHLSHEGVHHLLAVIHHRSHVAPGDVAHDHDLPLHLLAADVIGAGFLADIRQTFQRHPRAGGCINEQFAESVEIPATCRLCLDPLNLAGRVVAQTTSLLYRRASSLRRADGAAVLGFGRGLPTGSRRYSRLETCATNGFVAAEAHHKVEGVAALQHARHRHALDGRLHRLRHVTHGQAVAGNSVAVEVRAQDGHIGLLFDGQVHHARHGFHLLAGTARQQAQLIEVVAENLHRHVGPCAGQHVVNAVRNRLADDDVHAGKEGEITPQRLKQFLLGPLLHLQGHVNLRRLDALGVFVQLGAALASRHAGYLRMREQRAFNEVAILVGLSQRRAGQRDRAQGQRAFVELGQEGPPHEERRTQRQPQRHGSGHAHSPRMRQHGGQDSRVVGFQPGHHLWLLAFLHGTAAWQEQVTQHRRHGQRHQQRRAQRHDIREAQRFEQPPLDPAQEENRQENQPDDERGEDDGFLDFDAGVEEDLHRLLALLLRVQGVHAQPAENVFDENHGIIHQRADGDGHAAQRHRVDGGAEGLHHQNRHHQRKRNGGESNERGADVGQEQ